MKTVTVRLPDAMVAEIDAESRKRKMSRSDVVRERLEARPGHGRSTPLDGIADLIGSVDALPQDLSARRKSYLESMHYGRKRSR